MEKYERDLSVCESTLSRELSHGMFSTSSPSICFDRDHDLLADNELLARDVVSSTKYALSPPPKLSAPNFDGKAIALASD